MAGVEKVQQQTYRQPVLNGKTTGYAALASIGITAVSSYIKPIRKYHMPLGIIALGSSLLHLATILNYKKEYSKQKEFIAQKS